MDEYERELTPMLRRRNVPTAVIEARENSGQREKKGRKNSGEEYDEKRVAELTQAAKKQGTSQIIKYLDLSLFKIEKCRNFMIGKQHNIKLCRYYHTPKDRRRALDFSFMTDEDRLASLKNVDELLTLINAIPKPDLCQHTLKLQDGDKCPNGDKCTLAHNRVESVYHPEKYKGKYCTKTKNPDKADCSTTRCEYGDYCSFAHSTKELKTRLIHNMKRDADFWMFYFKTEWCPFNKEHNKAQCVYAHNW